LTIGEGSWTVRLVAVAEADFRDIVDWTFDQFGYKQALTYTSTILDALDASSRAGRFTVTMDDGTGG
jgi:plasmid stabilization system protein ParE